MVDRVAHTLTPPRTTHRTTQTDEGVASQLTGFLDNARSLFTHELPLPKDWAIWTSSASATAAETEGGDDGDDTASTDNWWFSSPVNRPPRPDNGNNGNGPPSGRPPANGPPGGRPPRPNNGNNGNGPPSGRPNNGNGGSGRPQKARRALQAPPTGDDTTTTILNWWFSSPIHRPPVDRPLHPNHPGNGPPTRALQWENEQDGGYGYPQPTVPPTDTYGYPQPTAPPTALPTDTSGSFPYGGEPQEPETPEYGEPVYEDPEHDKMAPVPGAEPAYRAKSPVVRALENVQFNKARAGQQPFNLRGSTKA